MGKNQLHNNSGNGSPVLFCHFSFIFRHLHMNLSLTHLYFVPGLYGSGGILPVEQSLKSDSETSMFSTKALLNLDPAGFVASFKGRAIQQFSSELGLEPDLAMEAVAIAGAIAAGLATIFPRYINKF